MPAVPGIASGSRLTPARLAFVAGNRPAAKLRQTIAQSIPNNTPTVILFGTEDLDTDPDGVGGHIPAFQSRYTARYSGWYRVGGGATIAANATGVRVLSWAVNGFHVGGSDVLLPPVAGVSTRIPARADLIRLNEGDYLELRIYQNSGGSLPTAVLNDEQPTMSVSWERL